MSNMYDIQVSLLETINFESLESSLRPLLQRAKVIGPKRTEKLLSYYSAFELCRLLADGNADMLEDVPGIGLKLSERIVKGLQFLCKDLFATWCKEEDMRFGEAPTWETVKEDKEIERFYTVQELVGFEEDGFGGPDYRRPVFDDIEVPTWVNNNSKYFTVGLLEGEREEDAATKEDRLRNASGYTGEEQEYIPEDIVLQIVWNLRQKEYMERVNRFNKTIAKIKQFYKAKNWRKLYQLWIAFNKKRYSLGKGERFYWLNKDQQSKIYETFYSCGIKKRSSVQRKGAK